MRRRKDIGRSYVCDDRTLAIGHSMHLDGMSVRQVARLLFDDCYSASPEALAGAFASAWRARGWEVRSQREATALRNRQAAFRPRCSHVYKLGARSGQRCQSRCVGNDRWCWKHDPEQIAAGVARLRSAA